VSDLDRTLSALADPTRRGVIELLRSGPLRAGELASGLEQSRPAMSRHLRLLRTSGLVAEEHPAEDARVRLYRLRPEGLAALSRWLEEVASFWQDELSSFKRYAEKSRGKGSRRR
jgi:DNA-binding transcriptional ArsR family regulator